MPITIEEVKSRKALRDFIFLPRELYRENPLWAPPIWMEERETFSSRNPVLRHSEYALFLVRDGRAAAGRILAYVDRNFNDFYGTRTGMFGSFECVESHEVAEALIRRAERWLLARDMTTVRGPINPVSECWGFLCRGYDIPPMFMSPFNPPCYNEFVRAAGYAKVKDLLVYEVDAGQGYAIPERFVRFRETLLRRRPNMSVRRLDLSNLAEEAEHIWRISNAAMSGNWGYVPLDRGELETMLKKLKPIADPDAVWMVQDGRETVGFAMGFPDLNLVLRKIKGRLLPFGFIRLLRDARRVRDFRLFGLAVLPQYQGMGLDVLLYMSLFETLKPRNIRLEANYILEDNLKIRNALEKLQMQPTKVYRVYEKSTARNL